MPGSKYLTGLSPEQVLTKAGQAHFAIPGETRTCSECRHWLASSSRAREAICSKARAMMGLKRTSKVPYTTVACKYFEAREAER